MTLEEVTQELDKLNIDVLSLRVIRLLEKKLKK